MTGMIEKKVTDLKPGDVLADHRIVADGHTFADATVEHVRVDHYEDGTPYVVVTADGEEQEDYPDTKVWVRA